MLDWNSVVSGLYIGCSGTCVFIWLQKCPHQFDLLTSNITWMADKSPLTQLAQHTASITSWCQESLDTIYVSRCSPTSALSELIGATQEVTGRTGPWSATLLPHPWLQMERSHFTWLILASCSDAPASVVLWCQRKASGLDKPPTTEFQHYLWARELLGRLSTSAWTGRARLSRPLTSPVSGAVETVKKTHTHSHRNVHYTCLFRLVFSYIITRGSHVCKRVSACVCV